MSIEENRNCPCNNNRNDYSNMGDMQNNCGCEMENTIQEF